MSCIRLDTTLADLYREHGIPGPFAITAHPAFAHLDLHPEFPRETVYPEDEDPAQYGSTEQDRARYRRSNLGLGPPFLTFAVGAMDVILFHPGARAENVQRVFGKLDQSQRPHARYVDLDRGSVQEQLKEITKGRKLLYYRPQGWMNEHDCLIDRSLSYEINSKRYLLSAGIQTPQLEMLNLSTTEVDSSALFSKALPFVVKLCLHSSGLGTFLVTDEDRRKEMLEVMKRYKSRGGTEVQVSAYIHAKQDLSIHFLVGAPSSPRTRENPLIMGVTPQVLSDKGHWLGTTIDYSAQSDLAGLVFDTVRATARCLPEQFVGWAGIDVLIDDVGQQWVVDLNARLTGTLPLCMLSSHFWKLRALPLAQMATFQYGGATGDLYKLLQDMIKTGQVVVVSAADVDEHLNKAVLIFGGRNVEDLGHVADLIKSTLTPTLP